MSDDRKNGYLLPAAGLLRAIAPRCLARVGVRSPADAAKA